MEAHELTFLIDAAKLKVPHADKAVQAEVERLWLQAKVKQHGHIQSLRGASNPALTELTSDVLDRFLKDLAAPGPTAV